MKNKYYYWISTAFKNSLIVLVACLLYGFIMYVGTEKISLSDIISETIMFYYLMISTAFISVFTFSNVPFMTDIALSLGSTRKDIVKGIHIFNSILIILFTIFLIILGMLSKNNIFEIFRGIITYSASLIISIGISSFISAGTLKKGAKLGLLYAISTLLSVAIPLISLFFSGTFKMMTRNNVPADFGSKEIIVTVITICFGIVAYIVGSLKMRTQLLVHEVRI